MYHKILEDYKRTGKYYRPDLEKLLDRIEHSNSSTKAEDILEVRNMLSKLPNYRGGTSDNKHRLAILVKELIGDRSIRRTAEDTGVAASYITGILQEKYLPSARILSNLAKAESHPQNGVMIEDLMIAAGYQNNYIDNEVINVVIDESEKHYKDGDKVVEPDIEMLLRTSQIAAERDNSIEEREKRRREFYQKRDKFSKLAKGLVFQGLVEKGIMIKMFESENVGIRGIRPDIILELSDQLIDEWWIEFKYIDNSDERNRRSFLDTRHTLGKYVFLEANPRRKVSIVTNLADELELLKAFKDKLSYRGELSVILVDMDNFTIIEEVYLSNFEQNNRELEIYLK